MAEKLVFDVIAKASGAADVRRLGEALDDVGKSADKLDGKSGGGGFFTKFTSSAKSAASSVGGTFTKLAADLESHGKKGGDGFGAGLVSGFTGVFGKIGEAAVSAGTSAGSALTKGMSSAFADTGPLAPVLFGALIVAAPAAGAVIGAALLAGIGVAGLGAGIALALQDPEIKSAAGDLGRDILDNLTLAAEGFKPVLTQAFSILGDGFRQALPDVQRFFSNIQSSVVPVSESLSRMGQTLATGFADATTQIGPVLEGLTTGLEAVVTGLSDGFAILGESGAEAGAALALSLKLIGAGLTEALATLGLFLDGFGLLAETGLLGPGALLEIELYKAKVAELGDQTNVLTGQTNTATAAIQRQSDALKAQSDPAFALIQAQQQLDEAQKKVVDTTNKYGASSQQAKDATLEAAKAALGMQKAGEQAGQAFNGTLTPAMKATLEAAGFTAPMIAQVEQEFKNAASAGKNFAKRYDANIQLLGLGGVQGAARAATAAINAIPSTKTITINAVGSGLAVRRWGGIDKAMASGGVVQAHTVTSPTVLYGERATKEEAYVPKNGNSDRSREILDKAAAWYGGRVSWPGPAGGATTGGGASAGRSAGSDTAILRALAVLTDAVREGGHVYLDNRLVGAVQGRQSDLYERAG